MEISVVIPTLNNRAVLGRALEALRLQTFATDQYEVVIVDDGSTDGTAEMIEQFRGPTQIQYLTQPNRGRAAARNAGARAARGRILVFLDSDVWAVPELLAEHHKHYPRGATGIGVQGTWRTHPEALDTPFMRAREPYLVVSAGPPGRMSLFRISTANLSLVKSDFLAADGFDEAFGGYGWEDIELAWRLRARGVRFSYEPRATGHHYQVQELEDLRKKMREGGRGAVYFWEKHRRSMWLGIRLEIAPALLPWKWLVYRTPVLTSPIRWVLPIAEARGWVHVLSECINHLRWEAYYNGVFGALRDPARRRPAATARRGDTAEPV